ncbi:MAG: site-specific DNA-methyltransferase [candidate division Zixibacteria bacterium]|nr:site-specific DNA-methyltransferase [Candidatus Tariuqbacter arcticus]
MTETEIKFIEPTPPEEEIEIPEQREFDETPARFGAVPVDKLPLGWEQETRKRETKITKFQHLYPRITLPFQEVKRVEFGHNAEFLRQNHNDPKLKALFPSGSNRLFFGDNLHIMRQLPSESIDLIYIDPPFFSGRNYNVIFGDKNEVRSFTDIWEGGMPGYLIWLNARLVEMKRLLKDTGSIYVHLDWHASHYVKVEMDKIFGNDNFQNEIIYNYGKFRASKERYKRDFESLLWYTKGNKWLFNHDEVLDPYQDATDRRFDKVDENGNRYKYLKGRKIFMQGGATPSSIWRMSNLQINAKECIGYPTQKTEELLSKIITASSNVGGIVADFFCGGGTTPAVAQRLNRRWIAADQSRIAVAITADRISKVVEEKIGKVFAVPDFTIEHWGIYEIPLLEEFEDKRFREFVIQAYGGRTETTSPDIHGLRYGVPLYVGLPSRKSGITKDDVAKFAKAIFEEKHVHNGTMLAWNFSPEARRAVEILALRENRRIDFVRLSLVRLESDEFRENVVSKSKEYGELLSFIQPPQVRVNIKRIDNLRYEFDVSETVSLNREGVIANVQWDFDYRGRFTTTQGYSFMRDKKTGMPILTVEKTFTKAGKYTIACSVQDNLGGERTEIIPMEVS